MTDGPIILYSTDCPKCKILEKKLKDKDIHFVTINSTEEMVKLGYASAPLLRVDGIILDFAEAIKWVNSK